MVGGLSLLLQNSGLVYIWNELSLSLLWSTAFVIGSLACLILFATAPTVRWWAVIPGFTLSGLAAIIFADHFLPVAEPITGSLMLGPIGSAFAVVFFYNKQRWWAIIPAGVLLTLALIICLEGLPMIREHVNLDGGFVFLLGLALTFLAVAILPSDSQSTAWAFIPAGILGMISLLNWTRADIYGESLWPVMLILAGMFLSSYKSGKDGRTA